MYKILIVDDERNERQGLSRLIKKYGYDLEISEAANGEEALEIMEDDEKDIILTDIKMPFMNGIDLIKEVLKRGMNPVCVIYSAYGEFEYAQNAIQLGVIQYLLKPVKLEDFKNTFDRIIEICNNREKMEKEKLIVKETMESAETERISRKLLRYLEKEEEDFPLEPGVSCIPVIISAYTNILSQHWENYSLDVKNIYGENSFFINKGESQFLIIIQDKDYSTKEIREKSKELIKLTEERYRSEIFIVTGKKCLHKKELQAEYEKLCEQLDYQFFLSGSKVFNYNEKGTIRRTSEMLPLYFERIFTYTKLEDYDGMRNEFEKAFDYVENEEGFSSIYVKYNFSEVIKHCCELLNREERLLQIMEEIYHSGSINDVKEHIFTLIDTLEEVGSKNDDEGRIVTLVKNIIHERYDDCSLSVSSIADELHITAAYLSTLFKSETGQTLVKYISQYRIEKAKELLKTTNLKISDIAEKVGYLNTSYFISLFKTNVGQSPAKYRENIYQNE